MEAYSKLCHMYIQVKYRGSSARVHQLSLAELLPATPDYVTYEVV